MNEDKLTCSIDGNALSIVRKDFINLAESDSVFIDLTEEQIKEIRELENGKQVLRMAKGQILQR